MSGTLEFNIFQPTIGSNGGGGSDLFDETSGEASTWSVCIAFRLYLRDDEPLSEAQRFDMLMAIEDRSPIISVQRESLALTVTAVGTRSEAVGIAMASAWTCLDACQVSGEIVGMDLISEERIDISLRFGRNFVFDTETSRATELQSWLFQVQAAISPVSFASESTTESESPPSKCHGLQSVEDVEDVDAVKGLLDGEHVAEERAEVDLLYILKARIDEWANGRSQSAKEVLQEVSALWFERSIELNCLNVNVVGQSGASRVLGVSRQRVHQLLKKPGAPRPALHVDDRPVWLVKHIQELRDLSNQRSRSQ